MNKQLWYANSTGGVPYTYGEVFEKETCFRCHRLGRVFDDALRCTERGESGWLECGTCKGKGYIRRIIEND